MPRALVKGINPQVLPPEVPVQWVGVTVQDFNVPLGDCEAVLRMVRFAFLRMHQCTCGK